MEKIVHLWISPSGLVIRKAFWIPLCLKWGSKKSPFGGGKSPTPRPYPSALPLGPTPPSQQVLGQPTPTPEHTKQRGRAKGSGQGVKWDWAYISTPLVSVMHCILQFLLHVICGGCMWNYKCPGCSRYSLECPATVNTSESDNLLLSSLCVNVKNVQTQFTGHSTEFVSANGCWHALKS